MRRWIWVLLVLAVVGIGAAVYLLRPVRGPERDLTLTADATHGAYLIRLGGCVSCHTDRKNGVAELGGGAGIATPFGTFYPPNITSASRSRHRQLDARAVFGGDEQWRGAAGPSLSGVPL